MEVLILNISVMVMVVEIWQNSSGYSLTLIKFIHWGSIYDFFHKGSNAKICSKVRISEPIKYSVTGRKTRLREITKGGPENPVS